MKLLLDQHLSRKLVAPLDAIFPGTTHVTRHGLEGRDDDAVWDFAWIDGLVIATKDETFRY